MNTITNTLPIPENGIRLIGLRTRGTATNEAVMIQYEIVQNTQRAQTLAGKPTLVSEWLPKRQTEISLDDPRMPEAQKELFTAMKRASESNSWDTVYSTI